MNDRQRKLFKSVEKYGYNVHKSKNSDRANETKEYLKSPLITITREIFRSQKFLDCIGYVCYTLREELLKLRRQGKLIESSSIAKLLNAGELEEHYILVNGAFIQHKKSDLPKWKRDIVYNVYLKSIEHYRRIRNAEARARYRLRRLKENGKTKAGKQKRKMP